MRQYTDTIISASTGLPVSGAVINVTQAGNAVQLYSDNGVTPITNPINQVTSNSLGLFQFFVADGTYTITISYGTATVTLNNVEIYDIATIAANYSIGLTGAGNTSIPNNTETSVGWGVETFKYGIMHSTSSNSDLVICPVAGLYQVNVTLEFTANATGVRKALLYRGATMLQEWEVLPGAAQIVTVGGSFLVKASAADQMFVKAFQTSGGALNVDVSKSSLSAILVKPL